jgi:hypothetical protein
LHGGRHLGRDESWLDHVAADAPQKYAAERDNPSNAHLDDE